MKPIPSTAEILAFKMLGRDIDQVWTDWAYDMLCAGFDGENLIILAGELEPYNQFELQQLTDKVLAELNLNWTDREQVYEEYVNYLITDALEGRKGAKDVLYIFKEIYLELDYDSYFRDFAMLAWAAEDLNYDENQWYWDGATRENIDELIRNYFQEWQLKQCS